MILIIMIIIIIIIIMKSYYGELHNKNKETITIMKRVIIITMKSYTN
jgi:hypothetical protein